MGGIADRSGPLGRFPIKWNQLIEKKRSQIKGPSILSAPNWAQDALGRFPIKWNHLIRKNRPLFKGAGILLAPHAARNALAAVNAAARRSAPPAQAGQPERRRRARL